jgi:SAM-dependent methyltransferase
MSWDLYFQKNKGRSVRPLYAKAVEIASKPQTEKSVAIDFGCGAGIESEDLLNRGWSVVAIDGEPSSIETTLDLVKTNANKKIKTICQRFEDLIFLPQSEFIYAYHSLPFCSAVHFDRIWSLIDASLLPEGIFAGSFFGLNDAWVKTGHTVGISPEKLKSFLIGFDVLHFEEVDQMGNTALSGVKHWHYIDVIAKKNARSRS